MGNKDEDILYAVGLLVYAVALFIVLFVGLIFIRKQKDSKSSASINILFSVSIVLLLVYFTFGAIANTLYFTAYEIPVATAYSIQCSSGSLFYLILLATLVFRLHITFKESTFEMTTRSIYLFSILLIVCLISSISGIIAFQTHYSDSKEPMKIDDWKPTRNGWILLSLLYWPLYFVGSAAAVWCFVGNLSKLAKLRINSPRAVTVKADNVSLDSTQQRMVNISAKYILLFLLAVLSTLSTYIGNMFLYQNPKLCPLISMIWTLDCCLNFICLYLQFSFATEHYHTFCGCLDNICRKIISKRTKTAIHRISTSRCEMPPTIPPSTYSGHATVHSASEIKTPN